MSYACGLNGFGSHDRKPTISCDADGCERRIVIGANGKYPPRWFLDGKAAPKWRMRKVDDKRRDWCPEHIARADKEPA